ncbi:NAD(P)/FAD-dependent oxidoreductase [Leisingera sp. ANG59]|uniref:NAD(P)/FAD-dependent oxidoreductase n=1 Tax=Leisingera sp. ANG59 TaxID=2675221 RepID=UPI0015729DB0|nr:FAD/NAD(P)-binding oxidoreductase [Leisingera sp. ANG59]NSY40909.1 FAD-dependent oxidoreductase [Leisingera sp. ANG59]
MDENLQAAESRVVVIGAGQAGFSVCSKLRSLGFKQQITLIGGEPHPPYQRPPLSKAYLLGGVPVERLYFRPISYYAEANIDLHLSASAVAVDRDRRSVQLSDGAVIPFDKLVLATGAEPVTLPAEISGNLEGVHYVRTLQNVDRMGCDIRPGRQVLVVGGGYIGLEAAAVAAKSGMKVTLVEASSRILQRVASNETARHFRNLHRENGVEIREGTMLRRLCGDSGRVCAAELSDGSCVDVDCVIVGIGIRPNQSLAETAGLEVENGICVDEYCQTSDRNIFAIGDCAAFPHEGTRIRLESVGNAIDQGEAAARVICGDLAPYRAKPWFWSDQFDTKLQIAGLSTGFDRVVKRGGSDGGHSLWYYSGNCLIAVDAIDDPRAFMAAKRLIEAGKSPDAKRVANPETDLKALLR